MTYWTLKRNTERERECVREGEGREKKKEREIRCKTRSQGTAAGVLKRFRPRHRQFFKTLRFLMVNLTI